MNVSKNRTSSAYSAARETAAFLPSERIDCVKVTGSDHVDLLHRLTTNELRRLKPGEGQFNVFTNEKGRVVDRIHLLKSENAIRLLGAQNNSARICDWIDKFTFIEDVKVDDQSTRLSSILFVGPRTSEILTTEFDVATDAIQGAGFVEVIWQNQPVIICKTPELNMLAFQVICSKEIADELASKVGAPAKNECPVLTEDDYETMRIEAGWPRFGHEFDENVNPHECGLEDFISYTKGCYIGQEVVARLDTYQKVQKHLMGIVLEGIQLPELRSPVLVEDTEVGWTTSSTYSPRLQSVIALALIKTKWCEENAGVLVRTDEISQSGKIVKLPFAWPDNS